MTPQLKTYKTQGHRWIEGQSRALGLGQVQIAIGAIDRAHRSFEEAVAVSVNGCTATETAARVRLAHLDALENRLAEAKKHVERCEAIVAQGNGWRAHSGTIAVARAAIAFSEGDSPLAERLLEQAIETFRDFSLPFEEAEAQLLWGHVLTQTDEKRAVERLDAAIDIYRSHEAGKGWIDHALKERQRES